MGGSPESLMVFMVCWWTQPQGDVHRLHRLLHDCYQVVAQGCQIHLIPQCSAESLQRPSCVILVAIEAPVNDLLKTVAERLEQRGYGEGRDHNSDSVILMEHPLEEELRS